MEIDVYREYLQDTEYKDDICKVFEFFEPYYNEFANVAGSEDTNYLTVYFSNVSEQLEKNKISKLVSKIRTQTRQYIFARPVFDSLSQNLSQFEKNKNRSLNANKIKWRKLLCSAYNFTRVLINATEFDNILKGQVSGKPILVAGIADGMGLEPEKDISKPVRLEIEKTIMYTNKNNDYAVLPVLHCSTNVFMSLMKTIDFNGVHFSGHGSEDKIPFSDNGMKLPTLAKLFVGKNVEFVVFNCCHSQKYVEGKSIPGSWFTVAHEGVLSCGNASDFSSDLYYLLTSGKDLLDSLNIAVSKNAGNYNLLIDSIPKTNVYYGTLKKLGLIL